MCSGLATRCTLDTMKMETVSHTARRERAGVGLHCTCRLSFQLIYAETESGAERTRYSHGSIEVWVHVQHTHTARVHKKIRKRT